MNKVILTGRLTKDVELRYGSNQKPIVKFILAVDRRAKEKEADFIPCTAFDKTAELMPKYLSKGSRIGITGHIQTGDYTGRDGSKRYTTDVIVETLEFLDSKKENETKQQDAPKQAAPDVFIDIPDDADLPF